jgi:hypothetical protein
MGLGGSRVGAGLCCWSYGYSKAVGAIRLEGFSGQGAPRADQMLKSCPLRAVAVAHHPSLTSGSASQRDRARNQIVSFRPEGPLSTGRHIIIRDAHRNGNHK